MRHAVFTVMLPEWTPEEAVGKLAEAGYDGVEWRVHQLSSAAPGSVPAAMRYWAANRCTLDADTLPERAAEVRRMTEAAGLEMPALGTYVTCEELEKVRRLMGAAAAMGAPMMRVGPPRFDGSQNYNDVFARAVDLYGKVEAAARESGVKATIEIHMNTLTPSPGLAQRLASHFDPRYVGVILDAGNMVYEGFESYAMAVDLLGPHLAHVHVKNAAWQVVGEEGGRTLWKCDAAAMWEGIADYPALLAALSRSGYGGYLSFEDFSQGMSTEEKLIRNLEYIRGLEAAPAAMS
ncbi:MAG: sugar phosphate isomerase/epimerase [Anaerolineae bacterium]|nr:sugar phosphate isomerase/epimerase [Anaerolineae bacterium]